MKTRAPRNRTLTCEPSEIDRFTTNFLRLHEPVPLAGITNALINQDVNEALPFLPIAFVDLLILDPPYNLTKNFNGHVFRAQEASEYLAWFEKLIGGMLRLLKPNATVYVCSDWQTSSLIFPVLNRHLTVRNRITWEREKGRGAKTNWKNNTEDIWFCAAGADYYFDVESVKLKRRVIAPYREENGEPKDWEETGEGNYRLTHPSNIWSDITIPFWSMPENTDHPTQKPERNRKGDITDYLFSSASRFPHHALQRKSLGHPVSPNLRRVSQTRRKPRGPSHLHPEHFLKSQFESAKNKNSMSKSREKHSEKFHFPPSICHFPFTIFHDPAGMRPSMRIPTKNPHKWRPDGCNAFTQNDLQQPPKFNNH